MNLLELFIEFIDDIYFPGYAEQISEDDPEKFSFEYSEFVASLN
jgi:hypothetical protein